MNLVLRFSIYSVLRFSIYLVLRIRSTVPVRYSLITNMTNFAVLRHPVTILVTALTTPNNVTSFCLDLFQGKILVFVEL